DPFRTELPGSAVRAALYQQPPRAQSRPIGLGQTIGLGYWRRQAPGQVVGGGFVVHSTASEPSKRLLTGDTIGPPITSATSLRGAWLVEVPRTWRTASSTSSKPCI